eukprot:CAMPEP_0175763790 /NCGR_PEP_ID=MMETSP0097-20121207/67924_1 /TAXON_ID=311494 /ORGANISM="Alexandrium monilatum, Strain CCMP3105" /LENGTH=161 /DNA_ID=CAMNT_0017073541 /DNA_START=263 /DNA_END=746 /DNA_ORIENTATION=+
MAGSSGCDHGHVVGRIKPCVLLAHALAEHGHVLQHYRPELWDGEAARPGGFHELGKTFDRRQSSSSWPEESRRKPPPTQVALASHVQDDWRWSLQVRLPAPRVLQQAPGRVEGVLRRHLDWQTVQVPGPPARRRLREEAGRGVSGSLQGRLLSAEVDDLSS